MRSIRPVHFSRYFSVGSIVVLIVGFEYRKRLLGQFHPGTLRRSNPPLRRDGLSPRPAGNSDRTIYRTVREPSSEQKIWQRLYNRGIFRRYVWREHLGRVELGCQKIGP